jgi:hypothetical protein
VHIATTYEDIVYISYQQCSWSNQPTVKRVCNGYTTCISGWLAHKHAACNSYKKNMSVVSITMIVTLTYHFSTMMVTNHWGVHVLVIKEVALLQYITLQCMSWFSLTSRNGTWLLTWYINHQGCTCWVWTCICLLSAVAFCAVMMQVRVVHMSWVWCIVLSKV